MKLPDGFKPYLPLLVTVLIAAFGGSTLALVVDDDDPATPPKAVITIDLPKLAAVQADPDQQQDAAEVVDAASEEHKASQLDIHEDARDETPAGVNPQEVAKGQERSDALADKTLREPVEPAGAQAYSCPARHVVNQSALSGRRVGVALHFTVSNPGSLDAIHDLFNRPSFGASSNYGFELFNLRCQEWVDPSRKAWAQGAANSAYTSIEIITNDRSRASWLDTPALKRGVLAALVADLLKKSGAPPKLVNPSGCVWPAGVTDHDRLECGNTHWDVGTHFPWDVFMRQVRLAYSGVSVTATTPLTAGERKIVARNYLHRQGKGPVKWRRYWCAKNTKQRKAIARRVPNAKGPARTRALRAHKRGARYHLLSKSYTKRCQ